MTIDEGIALYRNTKEALLLDVREVDEYERGTVPEAKNVPLSNLEGIHALTQDFSRSLFVFCQSGFRARKASEKLREMGYTHVYEIGGIQDYSGCLTK